MLRTNLIVAIRGDEGEPLTRGADGQLTDDGDQLRIGPVQVFDDDERRAARGDARERGDRFGEPRFGRVEHARPRVSVVERGEDVVERAERALREFAAFRDRTPRRDSAHELRDQPALSDARLAGDEDQTALRIGRGAPARDQMLEFGGSSDERFADDALRDHGGYRSFSPGRRRAREALA